MGTRADFYIRKEGSMEYLGSIGWDGYPSGVIEYGEKMLKATTEKEFRDELNAFFLKRNDVSVPGLHGWPWPWEDSCTTDYSYVFEGNKVMVSNWGYPLFDPLFDPLIEQKDEDESEDEERKLENFWPDMSPYKRVRMDKGSGLIVLTAK